MKFVSDIENAWRWLSLRIAALHSAVIGAWLALPADLKPDLTNEQLLGTSAALLILGAIGRVIDQELDDVD